MIKDLFRSLIITAAALFLVSQIILGFKISGGYQGIIVTSVVLVGINFAVKPIIKVLLLPVNLLTLGAFRWLANVFSLYLVTLLIPYLEITSFHFSGFVYEGLIIPEMLVSKIWTLLISSFLISLLSTFLFWLFK